MKFFFFRLSKSSTQSGFRWIHAVTNIRAVQVCAVCNIYYVRTTCVYTAFSRPIHLYIGVRFEGVEIRELCTCRLQFPSRSPLRKLYFYQFRSDMLYPQNLFDNHLSTTAVKRLQDAFRVHVIRADDVVEWYLFSSRDNTAHVRRRDDI